ncbi:MAG TPA: substrate-binding domain-containing protein, partial [Acidocella sp.]|nr:substrate-binding domain-containing protein [Acidocella sp.]
MTDNNSTPDKITLRRRMIMQGAPALLAAAGVAAMAKPAQAEGASCGPLPSHKRWKLVFVNHVTTNPFFVATQYGIQDACAYFGCDYQWTGSETAVVGEMVNAMDAAIASKADAIAVAIVDPTAFNGPTDAALKAGVPVFSYNADAPASSDNKRLAYIGQDLFNSGFQMGKRIVDLVGSGHVGLFIATPGQLNIQPRIDGAIAAIKASGKPITYDAIASGATLDDELPKVKAYYLGNPSVKGMFAVDAGSTQCVGQVIKEFGLRAKGITGGGFDLVGSGHVGLFIATPGQ